MQHCGKYLGDNDGTCPVLVCVRERGHSGLCDNVSNRPDTSAERETRLVGILRHALGLDRARKPYRNHYCADDGNGDCIALEASGHMERVQHGVPVGTLVTFRVTRRGIDAVASGRLESK